MVSYITGISNYISSWEVVSYLNADIVLLREVLLRHVRAELRLPEVLALVWGTVAVTLGGWDTVWWVG